VTLTEAETALYTIEGSSDLVRWTPLGIARPVDGQIRLLEPPAAGAQRFFRAVRSP
jgi:hypothetical protein